MSKRIVLTLTDEEYAALEARATAERRTPRQMAEYLVTRQPLTFINPPAMPIGQPWNPIWPPNVWCGELNTTEASRGLVTWNNPNANLGSGTQYPLLPIGTSGRFS